MQTKRAMNKSDLEIGSLPTKKHKGIKLESLTKDDDKILNAKSLGVSVAFEAEIKEESEQNHYFDGHDYDNQVMTHFLSQI